jgi:bifunctional non-homologous end joining protein LigD
VGVRLLIQRYRRHGLVTLVAVTGPQFTPMLAVSGTPPDPSQGWVEPKLDGWRAMVSVTPTTSSQPGRVEVRSRTGRLLEVPALAALAETVPVPAVFDGELIQGAGTLSDFYPLAGAVASAGRSAALSFAAFDLLAVDGHDVCAFGCEQRRDLLTALELHGLAWVTVPRWPGELLESFLTACTENGLEGLVWKRAGSRYDCGRRSSAWRKVKTVAWDAHARRRLLGRHTPRL